VLARLDALEGVEQARVEVTGRHFVVRIAPDADLAELSSRALSILGPDSRLLAPPWSDSEVAAHGRGELWLASDMARTLSLIEARMLASSLGAAAARAARLGAQAAYELHEILHQELVAAFEQVHDRGGTTDKSWWVRGFAAAFERVTSRLTDLTPAQIGAIEGSFRERIA